ncbi:MAG: DUF2797 domain-containing protein [Pseudomonadota bacterium]
MTEIQGHATKMAVSHEDPVHYTMRLDDARLDMNPLIGETVTLTFTGNIHCSNCGRNTKKSYSQGYCYPCSQRLAACDMCIVRPHTCHFDAGTCREPDWGRTHCYQDHFVYLANSSGLKVGITRQDQLPTRWIDQGATQALPVLRTRSRHVAGLIEHAMSQHVSDRTDWRKMLRGDAEPIDLAGHAEQLLDATQETLDAVSAQFEGRFDDAVFERVDAEDTRISYPVDVWPEKIKSYNLDKTPEVSAKLSGIKGQYLIFEDGVLNVRKYTSYELVLQA